MKILVLYDYPPSPSGLATQGDLLYKGLRDMGIDAHAAHFESAQEKEWYYRWFEPDIVVGVGYWGHTPDLILHPQRYGVQPVPWLMVISSVVPKMATNPILGVFYALGFSTGNVVGIMLERKLAFGNINLRVISRKAGREMVETIRNAGYGVTTFQGEGMQGTIITESYIVCRRKDFQEIMSIVTGMDPDAFYTTAQTGLVSRVYRPGLQVPTGWRAIAKKK